MVRPTFIPGPWAIPVDPTRKNRTFVTAAHPQGRIIVCQLGFGSEPGTVRATANLIAGAPDLYEALAIARNILAANNLPTTPKIDAALSKARGES